jgi:hypothetical protein
MSKVLKIANGASSWNQIASPGLASAFAIGSAATKPASATAVAASAPSIAE